MHHIALVAAALALTGCTNETWFDDDIDLTLNFSMFDPLSDPQDTLHTPYVAGADVYVYIHDRRRSDSLAGNTVESTDPDVFEVVSQTYDLDAENDYEVVRVEGHAVTAGEAELVLRDADGRERDRAWLEVGEADTVELHAAGPLFAHINGLETAPNVLTGGMATFEARYYDAGGRQLLGNGVLGATASSGLTTEIEHTYLFENRDWLRLVPQSAGSHSVTVEVDGVALDDVTVYGRTPDDITDVEIILHGNDNDDDGPALALAQAYDADGERVYGVEYQWDLDGTPQDGPGDLFRYEVDASVESELTADFMGMGDTTRIHSLEGYVDSSNNTGCTTTGGANAGLGLLFLLPLWVRRRRR